MKDIEDMSVENGYVPSASEAMIHTPEAKKSGATFNDVFDRVSRMMNPDGINRENFQFKSDKERHKKFVAEQVMVGVVDALATSNNHTESSAPTPQGALYEQLLNGYIDGFAKFDIVDGKKPVTDTTTDQKKVIMQTAIDLTALGLERNSVTETNNSLVNTVQRKLAVLTLGKGVDHNALRQHAEFVSEQLISLVNIPQETRSQRIDEIIADRIAMYAQVNFGIDSSEQVNEYLRISSAEVQTAINEEAFKMQLPIDLKQGAKEGMELALTVPHALQDQVGQELISRAINDMAESTQIDPSAEAGSVGVRLYHKMEAYFWEKAASWGSAKITAYKTIYRANVDRILKIASAGAVKKFIEMQVQYQTLPETKKRPESNGVNPLAPMKQTAEAIVDTFSVISKKKVRDTIISVLDHGTYRHQTIKNDVLKSQIIAELKRAGENDITDQMQEQIDMHLAEYRDRIAYPAETIDAAVKAEEETAESFNRLKKISGQQRLERRVRLGFATVMLALHIAPVAGPIYDAASYYGNQAKSAFAAIPGKFGRVEGTAIADTATTVVVKDAVAEAATLDISLPTKAAPSPIIRTPARPTNTIEVPTEKPETKIPEPPKLETIAKEPGKLYFGNLRLQQDYDVDLTAEYNKGRERNEVIAPPVTCTIDMSDVIDPTTKEPWRYAYIGEDGKKEWRNYIEFTLNPATYEQQRPNSPAGGKYHTIKIDPDGNPEAIIHSWQTKGQPEIGDAFKVLGDGTNGSDPVRTEDQIAKVLDQVRGKVMRCTQPDGNGGTITQYALFEMSLIDPDTLDGYYFGNDDVEDIINKANPNNSRKPKVPNTVLFARTCAVGPVREDKNLHPRGNLNPNEKLSPQKLELLKREQANYAIKLTAISEQTARFIDAQRKLALKNNQVIEKGELDEVIADVEVENNGAGSVNN